MLLPLFFAISAILIRLALFYFGFESQESGRYIFLLHILMILLSVFFGIMAFARAYPNQRNFTAFLKQGLKSGGLYTFILTGFLMVFYGWINPETFEAKKEVLIQSQLESAGNISPEQLAKAQSNMEEFFTVFNYSTISMLGFLVITIFYAAGSAALFMYLRKFLPK